MKEIEGNFIPVDFDDKDIMTDGMWESIYDPQDISYVTSGDSDWKTYFFLDSKPYMAIMDRMRGNRIIVTKLDGDWDMLDWISLKLIFMDCNHDDSDLFATYTELPGAAQFNYFRIMEG